ncbi:DNA primase [Streptomyces sp. NPDC004457]|uniref:DNA primase n=1 Tax=Streptomyces spinosus TaxID=2872623 RepID=UPI001CEC158B|nr:DNA primase [Streptomyces spinosus]
MNRTALGLAVGAGYLLGRTKKLKMALAVGSLAAGKKMNLSPRALAEQLNRQLLDNPQFKEIGDQLRQDLRGVGKAATGAMVERQMNSLADRLHGRTAQVRDQLSGASPAGSDEERDEEEGEDEEQEEHEGKRGERKQPRGETRGGEREAPRKKTGKKPAKQAPAKKASGGTAAGQAPVRKAPAKKAAAKKTDAARKTAAKKTAAVGGAARSAVSRQSKGGDDR